MPNDIHRVNGCVYRQTAVDKKQEEELWLSDIDGLFTDDPNTNPDAKFIDVVENLDDNLLNMGKGTSGSKVGTGGMATKLTAAQIASAAGVDMVIANGADFHIIHKITEGRRYGTLFVSQSKEEVYLIDIIDRLL